MLLIVSLLMVAAGAVLRYATDSSLWSAINEDMVGAVLLAVGVIGLLFVLFSYALLASVTRMTNEVAKKVHDPRGKF